MGHTYACSTATQKYEKHAHIHRPQRFSEYPSLTARKLAFDCIYYYFRCARTKHIQPYTSRYPSRSLELFVYACVCGKQENSKKSYRRAKLAALVSPCCGLQFKRATRTGRAKCYTKEEKKEEEKLVKIK